MRHGQRVVKVDDRGRGVGEWLQPTSIGPTETYIAVRELWVEGTSPTANAPDPYTLTVSWGPLQSGWEVEPNDWPSAATPITGGNARGYLGSAEDRDWFSVAVRNKGRLTGSVEAPAGVDLLILFDEAGKRTVDRHGAGDKETFSLDVQAGTAGADWNRAQADAREGSEGARIARAYPTRTSSRSSCRSARRLSADPTAAPLPWRGR